LAKLLGGLYREVAFLYRWPVKTGSTVLLLLLCRPKKKAERMREKIWLSLTWVGIKLNPLMPAPPKGFPEQSPAL